MGILRKRIAVFVGQADESYQSRFITGLIDRAFEYDMDVCTFSMYRKYQGTAEREKGESNIFSLMNPDLFDGAVILEDTIQTTDAAENLEKRLHEQFEGPVLVIEKESEFYESLYVDGYSAMKELVSHLIEVHGYRRLAFLSGKKWHRHSIQRLKAFRDAIKEYGIDVREDWIIYGDFWYNCGEQCAEHLISLEDELPEAVVCANDAMAIGLCDAFAKRGIMVPEDIAVVGFDSTDEGQTSPKSVTSAEIPARECGSYAMDYIKSGLEGSEPKEFAVHPAIVIGETCGCKNTTIPDRIVKRDIWGTDISLEAFNSVNNTMSEDLMAQTSLTEYLSTIYSYAYQIKGAESFHLCLCSKWKYLEDDSLDMANLHVNNNGYPEKMIYAIRYNSDRKDNQVSISEEFETKDILPELHTDCDRPRAFFFTPIFNDNECFGYAAVNYGSMPRSYDEVYRMWTGAVSRGFENIRRYSLIQTVMTRLEKMRVSKFDIGDAAYESLSQEEQADYKMVGDILDNNLLTYHFQPIVRTSDGNIFSYEALMRTTLDKWISPLAIIKYAGMQGRLSDVERATLFNVLRIVDDKKAEFGNAKVFINSIPGVKLYESDFYKMAELLAKNSDVAVVELTEEAELSDEDLQRLKGFFKKIHVETALDDYGTGYSNVSNLLRYMPNYVKIDRVLLSEIQNKPAKQHFVREIIEFCHDNNIMALAEGVETTEELRMVIHLGADLIQGFYTARPSAEIISQIDEKIRTEIKTYYQERQDGATKQIYIAGKTNRISLATLVKDGCTDIVVGQDEMVYKDIAIIGTPAMKTNVHMRVEPGYNGRITLENVCFSNVKNRPCIEIGAGADVTLVLQGNNKLDGSGIQVPENSNLLLEGDGNLDILLNAPEYYGIGNGLLARHGKLTFEQDGTILINTSGKEGVCIGSGLGGEIEINRGHYVLKVNGDMCVGIGATDGDVELTLDSCLVEADLVATKGVTLGSFNGKVNLAVYRSAVKCFGGGREFAVLGCIDGNSCEIVIKDSSTTIDVCSEYATCMGSLHGSTKISTKYAGVRIGNSGEKALAMGGFNDKCVIDLVSTDTRVEVHNKIDTDTYAKEDNIRICRGRRLFMVNEREIDRKLQYAND